MLFDRREPKAGHREQPCGAALPCASGPDSRTATTFALISVRPTVIREMDLNEAGKIDNFQRYAAQSILHGVLDEYYVPTLEEAQDVLRWARVLS